MRIYNAKKAAPRGQAERIARYGAMRALTDLSDDKQISAVLSSHYGDYKLPART